MKKIFYVLTLAAVVATAACSDDEKGMSEEQLYQAQNNDWSSDGLFGSVKRIERRSFYTSGTGWDSVAKKPAATPTKMTYNYVQEFNSAGYETFNLENENIITGAKAVDGDIVVSASEQRPTYEYKYTYDSKNRMLSRESKQYSYTISCGGRDLRWNRAWAGDTLSGYASNEDAFKLEERIYGSKQEYTYDDAAKTATILSYDWADDKWELEGKSVVTLNKYGFVDDNSNSEEYAVKTSATEFESKPSSGSYSVQDGQGNWTEAYSFSMGNVWNGSEYVYQPMLTYYTARDITYY